MAQHYMVGLTVTIKGDTKPWLVTAAEDVRSPEYMGETQIYLILREPTEPVFYNMGRPVLRTEVDIYNPEPADANPPAPRTMMLMQCIDGPHNGKYWLAETFMTSDGPRMRVIPSPGQTEAEARTELARREAIITPPKPQPNRSLRMAELEHRIRTSQNAMDASTHSGRCRTDALRAQLDALRKDAEL
jgi:hypothetical protein